MTTLIERSFPDYDNAYRRLDGVVCMYKDEVKLLSMRNAYGAKQLEPDEVYVLPYYLYSFEIPTNDVNRIRISYVKNEDLNIFDLNMGYATVQDIPICVGRLPTRTTQVGLSRENICETTGKVTRNSLIQNMFHNDIVSMFKGVYPTLNEAWPVVRSASRIGRAISPDIAVSGIEAGLYGVYYRSNLLGISTSLDPKFTVLSVKKKLARIYEDDLASKGIILN